MLMRTAVIALGASFLAQPAIAAPRELKTVAELEDFYRLREDGSRPISLKAVVQAFEHDAVQSNRLVIVEGEDGQRTCFHCQRKNLSVGDEIVLKGIAYAHVRNDPYCFIREVSKTGTGKVSPPLNLSLREIDSARHNLHELSTVGTVTDVRIDEADCSYFLLTLQEDDASLQLSVQCNLVTNAIQLLGSQILASGLYKRAISGVRKYNGPVLQVNEITPLRSADRTPFDAPPLDTHLYQSPEMLERAGRRTVCGEVLACWGGHSILLNSADGSLVSIEATDITPLPPVGAIITASGFPDTDRYHLFLSHAVCRIDGFKNSNDEPPNETSIRNFSYLTGNSLVFSADYHGQFIVIEGILISVPQSGTPDRHAYVQCEGIPLKVDFSTAPNAFENIEIGSRISIAGRGVVQVENKTIFNRYPRQGSFMLVLRSPQDIRVLKRPSWWTTTRLLSVIGLLLFGIAGLLARIWFQRRTAKLKLAERTRLAVELHDSLSQTLAGLACQIGATEDAIADKPEMVRPRLSTAKRMLQSCRSELRQCLSDLRSDILSETDFSRALARTIEPLKAFANVTVRFNVRRSLLDDSIAHATLAIVRELTANAIRHGAADSVRIAGTIDCGQLLFAVTDDGEGFDPEACAGIDEGHFGLNGIRERIKTLKGTFKIHSASGKGTRAAVTIPLNPK